MLRLSPDPSFHFEILRAVSIAPYQGADVGEVLTAAASIQPGDFESYYAAFRALALRVRRQAAGIDAARHPVSARNAYFREATYLRSAEFFLHGNWDDERIKTTWDEHRAAFDKAIALLPVPGQRADLRAEGFHVPIVFYGCGRPGRHPTVIMCNGYDGSQEELYHVAVEAALSRGINVITYEGPGQPTVRREQGLGFTHHWERVVSVVIDYALARDDVQLDAIGLWGYSLGGFLAARAAAMEPRFEPRIAAVMAIDGVSDFGAAVLKKFPPELLALFNAGNKEAFDQGVASAVSSPNAPTPLRWAVDQGLWAFNTKSPFEWATRCLDFKLGDAVRHIGVPFFVADAENDDLLPGQAKALADAVGELATYHLFSAEDGAGEHCSIGAAVLQNQVVFDWFQDVVSKN
ncbi:alpha/beta-hydrolase [Trichoderma citrinoviride]|uniref:Alpha/beta-hydrolase n=1 Tax=Trichoderma citrinoviride TaxID=58853 RepID=A0A2T4BJZ0_9HYPO|nr:alpha/beta-hydrolase [Trichoderma citrinoviride]PTB69630.1 alpha/beta-hydrolase [Trichoderma citrinoviride]